MAEKNLGEFLTSALIQRHSSDLLLHRAAEGWRRLSAGDVERQVRELTAGLLAYGAEPGARVGVFSEDRVEAFIAELAIHAYGGTVVPIAPDASTAELRGCLAATEARLVLASGPQQLARVVEARPDLPLLDLVLLFERPDGESAVASALLDSARSLGAARLAEDPGLFEAALRGARGRGGVWLSHRAHGSERDVLVLSAENLVAATGALEQLAGIGDGDVVVSLLPVTRAAHRAFQYAALRRGAALALATSLHELPALRPAIVIAERSLVEELAGRLRAEVAGRGWPRRAIARWTLRGRAKRIQADLAAGRFPAPGPLLFRLADALALHGVRNDLVGRNLRFILSVGLPLEGGTFELLEGSGLSILEGYDVDEAAGMVAMETPRSRNPGTVGRTVPDLEARIVAGGELQIRGPMVGGLRGASGASREATDGWLRTGRQATIREDGQLIPTS